MTIIYVFLFLALVIILGTLFFNIKVYFLRKKGKYPLKGQVKQEDVSLLVSKGQTILAMRAYRELHRCGLKQARQAIQQLK